MRVAVIGGGLTGLSAALRLQKSAEVRIFEENSRAGGLSKTKENDGFLFDYTGHFLHFTDSEIKERILSLLEGELLRITRKSFIYSSDSFVPYPFQSNLFYLPEEVRRRCLLGFLKASKEDRRDEENQSFHSWILSRFGEGIGGEFMLPYNEKLWGVHPSEMDTGWMGRFVPRPADEEILSGAIMPKKETTGYNASFYYPLGGIGRLPERIAESLKEGVLNLNSKVLRVERESKTLYHSAGEYRYDYLIVTSSLKKFLLQILDSPGVLSDEARKLRASSVLNVNLGWEGPPGKSIPKNTHWIYFPDKKISFYRAGFPSAVSPTLAPEGCTSCYTEISYPEGALPEAKDYPEIEKRVLKDLSITGIIPGKARIRTVLTLPIEPAYVIYNSERQVALQNIFNALEKDSIFSGGRYGGWEYSAMEDALLWGDTLAERCR